MGKFNSVFPTIFNFPSHLAISKKIDGGESKAVVRSFFGGAAGERASRCSKFLALTKDDLSKI